MEQEKHEKAIKDALDNQRQLEKEKQSDRLQRADEHRRLEKEKYEKAHREEVRGWREERRAHYHRERFKNKNKEDKVVDKNEVKEECVNLVEDLPWWEKAFGFDKNKIMEHSGMNQSEVDLLIKKRISDKKE